jgi:hypothetical protein
MINEDGQCTLEMPRVRDQYPIQTFGSNGPNEPFRDPICLRGLNRCANDSAALCLKHIIEAASELPIVIPNQETNGLRALSERPGDLSRLLRNPLAVRMRRAPAKCTRRLPISMKNNTYNRCSHTVSTVKKSTASMLFAWAPKNSRHDGPRRSPAGPRCFARRIFLTVVPDTATPMPFSSPTMRW